MSGNSRMAYREPKLTVIGTVSQLTQNDTTGPLTDAIIPDNSVPTFS